MQLRLHLLLSTIVLTLAFSSCSKDEEPAQPETSNTGGSSGGESQGGSTAEDPQIRALINEHVKISAEYKAFLWHFDISSTLELNLPGHSVKYVVGHGYRADINDEYIWTEDGYYFTKSSQNGIVKASFRVPFWVYYDLGMEMEDWEWESIYEEIFIRCGMYYNTYTALLEQGAANWTASEKSLFQKVEQYLKEYEWEVKGLYTPGLFVKVDSKYYLIGRYR